MAMTRIVHIAMAITMALIMLGYYAVQGIRHEAASRPQSSQDRGTP